MIQIMDYFPLAKPRKKQELVIKEIYKVMTETDKKFIIVEAPVGSGKSAIALTISRWLKDAHILTPLKSLQNQYYDEFKDYVTLMKGRSSYPCTYDLTDATHNNYVNKILNSELVLLGKDTRHCGDRARCHRDEHIYNDCTGEDSGQKNRVCPYSAALNVAAQADIIVHNFHSFIFQTMFANRFGKRQLLIIDEAHMTESIIRDFTSKIFTLPGIIKDGEFDEPTLDCDNLDVWADFFEQKQFGPKNTALKYDELLKEWLDKIDVLREYKSIDSWKEFVLEKQTDQKYKTTKYKFTPISIGSLAHKLIFGYGERVLLLSGTIYSKALFCKNLGIKQEEAHFIRIDSDFPANSRPIYAKQEYMVNTSHANWYDNFGVMIEKIETVLSKFPDAKGLIHVPSYNAGFEIYNAVNNNRLVIHDKDDFQSKLLEFYATSGNKVFVSPVCDQGVDFKDDRARFQIVTRVPYLNTGDKFVKYKLDKDYPWYNYQALVTFGQMLGRVNRSEEDYGATILLDERLIDFIRKNGKALPKWLTKAIVYK